MGTSSDTLSWSQTPGLAHPELIFYTRGKYSRSKTTQVCGKTFPSTLLPLHLASGNSSDYAKPSYSHLSPYSRIRPAAIATSAGEFLVMFEF